MAAILIHKSQKSIIWRVSNRACPWRMGYGHGHGAWAWHRHRYGHGHTIRYCGMEQSGKAQRPHVHNMYIHMY